jgi:reverse gyrase
LLDRFFILDHWEGILVANEARKKLDNHLDEEFHQRVSMEVTKKVTNIMKDIELQKKLASINVDEEFNHRVSKEALK